MERVIITYFTFFLFPFSLRSVPWIYQRSCGAQPSRDARVLSTVD